MGTTASIPTDKSRTLEVIGAGYSRTGTTSMAMALEILLEGPVMHAGTQLFRREDSYVKLWADIFRQRDNKPVLLKLLREATAGFVGITDITATMFLPELMELYPDAKVVLVTRDLDAWHQSVRDIRRYFSFNDRLLKLLLYPCPGWRWFPVWKEALYAMIFERFGVELQQKELLIRYHEHVHAVVKPESKLLTMELKQGWLPLATFLGKPVPQQTFPRYNERKSFGQEAKRIIITSILAWVAILSSAGLLAWGVCRVCKSQVSVA